jgi:hypothetical protein
MPTSPFGLGELTDGDFAYLERLAAAATLRDSLYGGDFARQPQRGSVSTGADKRPSYTYQSAGTRCRWSDQRVRIRRRAGRQALGLGRSMQPYRRQQIAQPTRRGTAM